MVWSTFSKEAWQIKQFLGVFFAYVAQIAKKY